MKGIFLGEFYGKKNYVKKVFYSNCKYFFYSLNIVESC